MTTGLNISTAMLVLVQERAGERARTRAALPEGATANSRAAKMARSVTSVVLNDTLSRRPSCQCEELGLVAGMLVGQLHTLGAGCTAGQFVCPRLDSVRRAYGA